MNDKITSSKLDKYFDVSKRALEKAKSSINRDRKDDSAKILDMVERYLSDAEFFRKNGDFVNAFAALNYAHGWLDTGSKLGIFDVDDDSLFVLR